MVYVAHDCQDDLVAGTRMCRRCGLVRPMERFHLAKGGRHRRRVCKDCAEKSRQALRAADPERTRRKDRAAALLAKYGLTEQAFNALMESQGNLCAICARGFDLTANRVPHVDHDHVSGEVRGVLCFTCNTALGKFQDSPDLLRAAIRYLGEVA